MKPSPFARSMDSWPIFLCESVESVEKHGPWTPPASPGGPETPVQHLGAGIADLQVAEIAQSLRDGRPPGPPKDALTGLETRWYYDGSCSKVAIIQPSSLHIDSPHLRPRPHPRTLRQCTAACRAPRHWASPDPARDLSEGQHTYLWTKIIGRSKSATWEGRNESQRRLFLVQPISDPSQNLSRGCMYGEARGCGDIHSAMGIRWCFAWVVGKVRPHWPFRPSTPETAWWSCIGSAICSWTKTLHALRAQSYVETFRVHPKRRHVSHNVSMKKIHRNRECVWNCTG